MVLREMQAMLARFYDTPSDYDVYDFLATDRRHAGLSPRCSDEQVLIAEGDDGLQLSVFIDSRVLARLAKRNPLRALGDENLSDYCTAFEGVSHFHYLTWRAAMRVPVTLLELELQAEVDKYVGAMVLLTRQQSGRYPTHLHERLFDRVSFDSELDVESRARYRLANRGAAHYCRKLDERFFRVRRQRPEAWLAELRKFYRYGHAEKIRRAAD
jgi:hypothetical protein